MARLTDSLGELRSTWNQLTARVRVMTCWFTVTGSTFLGAAAAVGGHIWLSPLLFLPGAAAGAVGAAILLRGGPGVDRFLDDLNLGAAEALWGRPRSRRSTKWLWTTMFGITGAICAIGVVAQVVDLLA